MNYSSVISLYVQQQFIDIGLLFIKQKESIIDQKGDIEKFSLSFYTCNIIITKAYKSLRYNVFVL